MSTLHFPATRWGAAATHVGFSAILLLIVFSLVYFIWYPGALTFAGGAEVGLKIVIAVDMVLGPLLTLVIYNIAKPKKELIRDLSFIALIQIACLGAGMKLVYEQRPLAVVYDNNIFQIYDLQKLEGTGIQLNLLDKFSGPYPKLILETPPEDPQALAQHTVNKMLGITDVSQYWSSLEKGSKLAQELIDEEGDTQCIKKNIKSYNSEGSICFDTKNLTFSNYQKL